MVKYWKFWTELYYWLAVLAVYGERSTSLNLLINLQLFAASIELAFYSVAFASFEKTCQNQGRKLVFLASCFSFAMKIGINS